MQNKTEFRKIAKEKRQTLDISNISKRIVRLIRESSDYKTSNKIMIFYPMKNEINLLDLMRDDKKFYLPKVNGKDIDICPYKSGDYLELSKKRILEPVSEALSEDYPDIIFVPALAADYNFNRLGYGGGYYDRLRSIQSIKSPKTKFIIVIPEELIVERVPVNSYDRQCDGIITQKKASF